MIYELDEERIAKEFNEGQIQGFMKDLGFSRIETLIYLWAYNHFFTCAADVAKDNGRPMYRELARTFSKLLCVKENVENVTQTDLRNIEDIQYPSRHDKTAYELKIENNKQQAEINRLKKALEKIILYAPGCYNTAECPLNVGGGFDGMCGYKCAFVIAHKALNSGSEGK